MGSSLYGYIYIYDLGETYVFVDPHPPMCVCVSKGEKSDPCIYRLPNEHNNTPMSLRNNAKLYVIMKWSNCYNHECLLYLIHLSPMFLLRILDL